MPVRNPLKIAARPLRTVLAAGAGVMVALGGILPAQAVAAAAPGEESPFSGAIGKNDRKRGGQAQDRSRQRGREQAQDRGREQAQERSRQQAQDRARQQAQERSRQQAEDRARQQAQDRARQQAQERSRQQTEDRARQQAQDRARQQTEDRARQQAQDRARQQAEDRGRQQSQDRARQQAQERAIQDARQRAEQDRARQRGADDARQRAIEQLQRQQQQRDTDRSRDNAQQRALEEARQRAEQRRRDDSRQQQDRDSGSVLGTGSGGDSRPRPPIVLPERQPRSNDDGRPQQRNDGRDADARDAADRPGLPQIRERDATRSDDRASRIVRELEEERIREARDNNDRPTLGNGRTDADARPPRDRAGDDDNSNRGIGNGADNRDPQDDRDPANDRGARDNSNASDARTPTLGEGSNRPRSNANTDNDDGPTLGNGRDRAGDDPNARPDRASPEPTLGNGDGDGNRPRLPSAPGIGNGRNDLNDNRPPREPVIGNGPDRAGSGRPTIGEGSRDRRDRDHDPHPSHGVRDHVDHRSLDAIELIRHRHRHRTNESMLDHFGFTAREHIEHRHDLFHHALHHDRHHYFDHHRHHHSGFFFHFGSGFRHTSYVWSDCDWFYHGVGSWSFGHHDHHHHHGHHHSLFRLSVHQPGLFFHRPHYYHRPWYWWYDGYCDSYYGAWYRPYVHVTRTIYRPTYFDSGYDSGYFDAGGGYAPADSGPFADDLLDAGDMQELPITFEDAWNLLSDGYLSEARDAFAELAEMYPFDPEARIGSAISVGLLGNEAEAVESMRAAVADDATVLEVVPLNASLERQIARYISRLDERSAQRLATVDELFMAAALRYILDQEAIAFFTINRAVDAGDQDASTINLQTLIRERMYEGLYAE